MGYPVRFVCACALLLWSVSSGVFAQTAATGTVEGTVMDTRGGVVTDTVVSVRNMDTNVLQEQTTDAAGRYRASALQPGRYEVSAVRSGFTVRPVSDVIVQVGQTVAIDLTLQPAGVDETIVVVAALPLIDPRRVDVSTVLDESVIQNLPTNGRRWDNFVLLGPGVTNDGSFGLVSYRGISGLYNNNMVDGVDNNQAFFSEARGRTRAVYSISAASIKEFQVGVSNMSAEFGRAVGGTVNAVTKSGSNSLAGEVFYFLRDKAFQSKDPFIPQTVWDRIDERRQQFGGAVGGPIVRDKVFFFANYDQQKRTFPPFVNTSSATFYDVCTAPAPNCAAAIGWYRSLEVPSSREANNKVGFGKINWNLSPTNQLAFSYNAQRWRAPNGIQTQSLLTVAESANGTDIVTTDFGVFNWNSFFGSGWSNEFRAQGGRDFEEQTPNGVGPSTTVTGGISFGMPNFLPRPAYPHEQRYQVLDNVTLFRGGHTVKVGADINYVKEELINLFQGGGVYNYSSLTNVALDCPKGASGCVPVASGAQTGRHYTSFTQAFDLNGLAGALAFNEPTYAFFVQDNWLLSGQLQLSLGLRYEYQSIPQPGEVETNGIKFSGNPAVPETTRFNRDRTNWAPRVGLAYQFGGNHEMVLRGAYGLFYGLTSNSAVANALTNNGVSQSTFFFNPTTVGAPAYPDVLSAPPAGAVGNRPDINYFADNFVRPRVHSADVTLDRHVGSGTILSLSYLFSRGTKLPHFRDVNLSAANSTVNYVLDGQTLGSFPLYRGTRPNPSYGRIIVMESSVDTEYNGLVVSLNKRFADGLLFNTNYTLSKAEDNGQTSATFFPTGDASGVRGNVPFDTLTYRSNPLDNPIAPSNNDRRHRFVGSFHYQPAYLWGVGVGGILTLESGLPITQKISGSLAGTIGAVNSASTNGSGGSLVAPWVGFNTDRQTGRKTFDMRVSKEVNVSGSQRVQVLWEVFNLFNTVNYASFFDTAFDVASSSYEAASNVARVTLRPNASYLVGRSASTNFWGPRDMQLGLKFLW